MYQIITFLLALFIAEIRLKNVHFAQLLMEDIHFDNTIGVYNDTSLATCLALSLGINNCTYVGFEQTTGQCLLHNQGASVIQGVGRTHYIRTSNTSGSNNTDLMTGATAWQQSTYLSADKAIDGNFDQNSYGGSCSHTHDTNSYWVMEFGMAGVVASVDLYLRADYPNRNTNYTVLISLTREDVDSNIGMECGRYFGPVLDTPPYLLSLKCPNPIYGKFLKVKQESLTEPLELCEVVVHSI